MTTAAAQISGNANAPAAAPVTHHESGFRDFLSAINPLQYLPLVGTIYRAATGDVIPEPLRQAGSLLFAGLVGGPVGVLSSIAVTIAEKITGIDPEKIAAAQFHGHAPAAVPEAVTVALPAASGSPQYAITPAQLAAYGVRFDASGTMRLGSITGADVLNALEQGRHAKAAAAYAANQAYF